MSHFVNNRELIYTCLKNEKWPPVSKYQKNKEKLKNCVFNTVEATTPSPGQKLADNVIWHRAEYRILKPDWLPSAILVHFWEFKIACLVKITATKVMTAQINCLDLFWK